MTPQETLCTKFQLLYRTCEFSIVAFVRDLSGKNTGKLEKWGLVTQALIDDILDVVLHFIYIRSYMKKFHSCKLNHLFLILMEILDFSSGSYVGGKGAGIRKYIKVVITL